VKFSPFTPWTPSCACQNEEWREWDNFKKRQKENEKRRRKKIEETKTQCCPPSPIFLSLPKPVVHRYFVAWSGNFSIGILFGRTDGYSLYEVNVNVPCA
jgi:hypothetical protein